MIGTHVHITADKIVVNGEEVAQGEDIIRQGYDLLEMAYPKFFKMDRLCKLGVLGTEFIVKAHPRIQELKDDDIALLFNNSDSSLESDVKHQKSFREGAASPAIFVYTLPNIVLGELGIRHKWHGEQLFTVTEEPDINFLYEVMSNNFAFRKAKACVLGIVNSLSDNFEAHLIWIENKEIDGGIPFTALNLKQIIK
ncbi:MAG: hypothetical protein ACI84C_000431 [Flavobacteriales bacterium]|jgi:hypothetical protein